MTLGPPIRTDALEVAAAWEGGVIHVVFKGSADMRAMASLAALASSCHVEARRAQCKEIVLDIRRLDFMNSSCFKVLVSWLRQLGELAESEQYTVKFLASRDKHWQERSLAALVAFAPDHTIVKTS